MADIAVTIATKVAECLVAPIGRRLSYLFCNGSIMDDLNKKVQELEHARDDLQRTVDEAIGRGDEIRPIVQDWLNRAHEITEEAGKLLRDKNKGGWSRYQLSREAKNKAQVIAEIQKDRNFPDGVSYCVPVTFRNYEAFESRASILNGVMDALRDDETKTIGVYGIGGVGKTTLVKRVAEQARQEMLFTAQVYIDVSWTRDSERIQQGVSEIQQKIARMLGLEFTNEAQYTKAGKLMQILLKEKILVILDNIWKEIDLEEVGIPYQKGCKIVLTSRHEGLLQESMGAEKCFPLEQLPPEDAWSFFKKTAGDSVEGPQLMRIARKIVGECEGLPIAIVAIAEALKDKHVIVWENTFRELERRRQRNIRGAGAKVHSCLELSYNHLEGEEVKRLFLLCGMLGDGDISVDDLLKYGMGLDLFEHMSSLEQVANKLVTLVKILKNSSLLLDVEDGESDQSSSFIFEYDQNKFVRMHRVVCAVSRAIASKYPFWFVVKKALQSEKWTMTEEIRRCTRMLLKCRDVRVLSEELVCPKLELFILNSNDSSLRIPNTFFQEMRKLKVLDLSKMCLTSLPSSLCFLPNLRTLCLDQCQLGDITVIGELKTLQVLSFVGSNIKQLPKEMMQLSYLMWLDLRNCSYLKVIPRNVISSLSRLECLCMENSFTQWEVEGFNSGESSACLSELKHLSCLRALEVKIPNPNLLPQDMHFDNLTRYRILVGDHWKWHPTYKASRTLKLSQVKSPLGYWFSKLLRRIEDLELKYIEHVNESDMGSFLELKYLGIHDCPGFQYIVNSMKWVSLRNALPILEELRLWDLINLNAVCHGPIPVGCFGNLRILKVGRCENLQYLLVLPTGERRELVFRQLRFLSLEDLPKLRNFYSTRTHSETNEGSQGIYSESMLDAHRPFFNQQLAFPKLEVLQILRIKKIEKIWHDQVSNIESFGNLKKIRISHCRNLLSVFTISIILSLLQLETLEISSCGIEVIFAKEDEIETPVEVVFPKLTYLKLMNLKKLKCFYPGKHISKWPLLKKLEVCNCEQVETLFQDVGLEDNFDDQVQQSFFMVEKAAFPSLEDLDISNLDNVEKIWHNEFNADSFRKLKRLSVGSSQKLQNVIPYNMLKGLPSLQILKIVDCNSVEEVFDLKDIDFKESHDIPVLQLRELCLDNLKNLKYIWNKAPQGLLTYQNLNPVRVSHCPSLEIPFPGYVVRSLLQLKQLGMNSCGVRKMAAHEDVAKAETMFLFPEVLTSLSNSCLKELECFYLGLDALEWPMLETLKMESCESLEILASKLDNPVEQPIFLWDKAALPNLKFLNISLKVDAAQHLHLLFGPLFNLKTLTCKSCPFLLNLLSSDFIKSLKNLENLTVEKCDRLQVVFDLNGLDHGEDEHVEMLSKLEELNLIDLPELKSICNNKPPQVLCFRNLKWLQLQQCDSLRYLFSSSMAFGLGQLRGMWINYCSMLEEIVAAEEGVTDKIIFPEIKRVSLRKLPKLTSFYLGIHPLEKIHMGDSDRAHGVLFNEKVAFPKMLSLYVSGLDNVKKIWHHQLLPDSFGKLNETKVENCNELLNISKSNVLNWLPSLEFLGIASCHKLAEVFDLEVTDVEEDKADKRLSRLALYDLPNLEHICSKVLGKKLCLQNLKFLRVHNCGSLKNLFSPYSELEGEKEIIRQEEGAEKVIDKIEFPKLASLSLKSLPSLASFYPGNHTLRRVGPGDHGILITELFDQKVAFPSLEDLDITDLDTVEKIWHNEFIADSFGKLKSLSVRSCQKLPNVIPSNMLKGLSSLQSLKIVDCNSVEEVFNLEALDIKKSDDIPALQLRELCLDNLKNLKYVWNQAPQGLLAYDNLKSVQVSHCPSLEIPFPGYVVRSLLQLKEVHTKYRRVEEIVAHEDVAKAAVMFLFPEVTSLTKSCPKELTCFYLGMDNLEWRMLETLEVESCEGVEKWASKLHEAVNKYPIFLCDKVALPNLEFLSLSLELEETQHLHLLFGALFNLKTLIVENCPFLLNLFASDFITSLRSLKILTVKNCHRLQGVFDLTGLDHAEDEQVEMLSKLEELKLIDLPELKSICNNSPPQVLCFRNLKILQVKHCDSLMYLFLSSMALGLVQLQDICIDHCSMVEQIVTAEEGVTDNITFPEITRVSLLNLPKLTSFFLRTQTLGKINMGGSNIDPGVLFNEEVAFPKLEILNFSGLDNVKQIWHHQLLKDSFGKLKEMKVENCNELLNISKSNVLNWLPSLEVLGIASCGKLQEIFDLDVKNVQEDVTDNRLSQLVLDDLQNLEHICNKILGKKLCLQNLKFLKVHNCGSMKKLFSSYMEPEGVREIIRHEEGAEEVIDKIDFPELTSLSLKSLPSLTSFYPGSHTLRRVGPEDHDILIAVLFNEKVAFPSLKSLHISGLDNIKEIWNNKRTENSFSKLEEVKVEDCNKLQNGLPLFVMKWLLSLRFLGIANCGKLKEVFDLEGAEILDDATDIQLKELKLHDLPQLQYIWNRDPYGIITYENLELVEVLHCEVLKVQFPSPLRRDLSQFKTQLIRFHLTKDLREKSGGRDFVLPQVIYNGLELPHPQKSKGKEMEVVGECSGDMPGSSG